MQEMERATGTDAAVPGSRRAFPSASYYLLWIATGISQTGSAVSVVVLPIVAAVVLHASAAQMAYLAAVNIVSTMLVEIPAATWSDRLRTRRVPAMALCNVVQASVVGLVPLLTLLGDLNFTVLLALAAIASVGLGVYSALASPLLVEIVPAEYLVDANGRFSATRSVGSIAGPALAGALLAVITAPFVVLVDAISFILSGALLSLIRVSKRATGQESPAPPRDGSDKAQSQASYDLHWIPKLVARVVLRSAAQAIAAVSFVNGMTEAIMMLYLVHTLHIRPSTIGLLFSFGAIGGITGGLIAGRCHRSLGEGRTLAIGAVATICSMAMLPFASPGWLGDAALVVFELAGSFGGTLMIATFFGGLQSAAPEGRVASVMAVATNLMQISALAGIALGGALGTAIGLRHSMLTGFALMIIGLLPQVYRWSARNWNIDAARIW